MTFDPGSIVSTPAALRFCQRHKIDMLGLVARHSQADWGEMSSDDLLANDVALVDGSRLFSSYTFPAGKIWVVSDATDDDGNRASTCVMLPADY